MKTKLYEGSTPEEILENLKADNSGVENNHSFLKPFEPAEQVQLEKDFLKNTRELTSLEAAKAAAIAPLDEKMKPLKKEVQSQKMQLHEGGEEVVEAVFLYPDFDNKMMALYDGRGVLVGTRAMTRAERQFHINYELSNQLIKD